MFVILLSYKKPIETVDQYLVEHRNFLDEGYQNNYLLASGPRNPRTGGVLISPLKDKTILDNFIKQDPFYIHEIANYEIIEFEPVKYHPQIKSLITDTL